MLPGYLPRWGPSAALAAIILLQNTAALSGGTTSQANLTLTARRWSKPATGICGTI